MFTTIQFAPGAVNANTNIDLPTTAPKIDSVVSAYLIRPTSQISIANHTDHSHTENVAASYTQNATTATATLSAHTLSGADPVVAAVPTKVDEDTITLNVNTVAGDLLVLSYIKKGVRLQVV